jgi:hypothetical protein
MRCFRITIGVAAIIGSPVSLPAQQASSRIVNGVADARTVDALTGLLKDIVVQEEVFYSTARRYTKDTADLIAVRPPSLRDSNQFVVIHFAGQEAWSAEGTDTRFPTKSCVIYIGRRMDIPVVPATRESHLSPQRAGIIRCDAFPDSVP